MSYCPLSLAAGLAALLAVPAVAQQDGQAPSADTVVATVDGTEITLGHMIAMRERLPQQYAQLPAESLFSGVLDQLVQQQALAGSVEETPRKVELTLENERRALLSNEALSDTTAGAASEEEIRAAYEETYGDAGVETEYNASHILVETREEAEAVIEELESGADFGALARERSTGPSSSQGGDLGWFGSGMMVPAFEQAVAALSPGEVSAPVESQFGWHVIVLNDTREKQPPTFDEVRDQIAQRLRNEAVSEVVDQAVAEAEVERPDLSGIDPSVINDTGLIE